MKVLLLLGTLALSDAGIQRIMPLRQGMTCVTDSEPAGLFFVPKRSCKSKCIENVFKNIDCYAIQWTPTKQCAVYDYSATVRMDTSDQKRSHCGRIKLKEFADPTLEPTPSPTSASPSAFPTTPQPTTLAPVSDMPTNFPTWQKHYDIEPYTKCDESINWLKARKHTLESQAACQHKCSSVRNCRSYQWNGRTKKCIIIRYRIKSIASVSNVGPERVCAIVPRSTKAPTTSPTPSPTKNPTNPPTPSPTADPTKSPTASPTPGPTKNPTASPTPGPTKTPTPAPSKAPTTTPTTLETKDPTASPTPGPTKSPTASPTPGPTKAPTPSPTPAPTKKPTEGPTTPPTPAPTKTPTPAPTEGPTKKPTEGPTPSPTKKPTEGPTPSPSKTPTASPTPGPTKQPTPAPTPGPTKQPTPAPTPGPTKSPSSFCALEAHLGFPFGDDPDNAAYYGYHSDYMIVTKEGDDDSVCTSDFRNNLPTWCSYENSDPNKGSANVANLDDVYYDDGYEHVDTETINIYGAADSTFVIHVQHWFFPKDYYPNALGWEDHMLASVLKITNISNSDQGELNEVGWTRPVELETSTHVDGEINPEYEDSFYVTVSCDSSCMCDTLYELM